MPASMLQHCHCLQRPFLAPLSTAREREYGRVAATASKHLENPNFAISTSSHLCVSTSTVSPSVVADKSWESRGERLSRCIASLEERYVTGCMYPPKRELVR